MLWEIDPDGPEALRDQIATSVRRGITTGDLAVGDPLPPASELADALSVDRNTVLAAYRQLRADGVLEFRRGRGARVARATAPPDQVLEVARQLLELGRRHGLASDDLIQLIKELS